MELRHLRYFVAVAEERHFTRAAARLNIQQPPLSQQIRALEQELGFELFRRHPRGVDLTAGGEALLEEARAILARVERGTRRATRVAQGVEGELSIGFTSSAAAHGLIPRLIRRFREDHPGVLISLRESNAQGLTDEVAGGELDLAILRAPVGAPAGVRFHRLLNEDMRLVLPVDHPRLEGRVNDDGRALSLGVLEGEPLILVRRPGAPGMYANLLRACRNAGFEPRVAFEVERMLTNLSLVASGAGLSVVPASMSELHRDSLVYCPILDAHPRLAAPLTLAHRESASPALERFVELAREAARQWRRQQLLK